MEQLALRTLMSALPSGIVKDCAEELWLFQSSKRSVASRLSRQSAGVSRKPGHGFSGLKLHLAFAQLACARVGVGLLRLSTGATWAHMELCQDLTTGPHPKDTVSREHRASDRTFPRYAVQLVSQTSL